MQQTMMFDGKIFQLHFYFNLLANKKKEINNDNNAKE